VYGGRNWNCQSRLGLGDGDRDPREHSMRQLKFESIMSVNESQDGVIENGG
jgi:hypothetical protein